MTSRWSPSSSAGKSVRVTRLADVGGRDSPSASAQVGSSSASDDDMEAGLGRASRATARHDVEPVLERLRLRARQSQLRRAAADPRVILPDGRPAHLGNDPRHQGLQGGPARQFDDLPVGEQLDKEGLDFREVARPTEVEELLHRSVLRHRAVTRCPLPVTRYPFPVVVTPFARTRCDHDGPGDRCRSACRSCARRVGRWG